MIPRTVPAWWFEAGCRNPLCLIVDLISAHFWKCQAESPVNNCKADGFHSNGAVSCRCMNRHLQACCIFGRPVQPINVFLFRFHLENTSLMTWSVSEDFLCTSCASFFNFSRVAMTELSSRIFPFDSFKAANSAFSNCLNRTANSPWSFSKSLRFASMSGRSLRRTWWRHCISRLAFVMVKLTKVTREQTSAGNSTLNLILFTHIK